MKADISAASITRRSVMVSANVRKSIVSAEGRSIYNRLMKSTTAYVGSGTIVGACRLGLSDESIAIVVSGVATLSAGSTDSAMLTAAAASAAIASAAASAIALSAIASALAAIASALAAIASALATIALSLTLSAALTSALSSTGSSLVSSRSNAIWSRIESSIKPAKSGLFKQSESMKRVSVGKSIVSVSPSPDCI